MWLIVLCLCGAVAAIWVRLNRLRADVEHYQRCISYYMHKNPPDELEMDEEMEAGDDGKH